MPRWWKVSKLWERKTQVCQPKYWKKLSRNPGVNRLSRTVIGDLEKKLNQNSQKKGKRTAMERCGVCVGS